MDTLCSREDGGAVGFNNICEKDINLLKSYLNNIQEYYDFLEMNEVWNILKPMIEDSLSEQASKSRSLLLSIRSVINNSILK